MSAKFGKVASFLPRFYQFWSFYLFSCSVGTLYIYIYTFTFSHIVRPADHLTSELYD